MSLVSHPAMARFRALGLCVALLTVVGCGGPTEEELAAGAELGSTSEALSPGEMAAPQPVVVLQARVAQSPRGFFGAIPPSMGLNAPTQAPSNPGDMAESPDPIPARGGDGNPDTSGTPTAVTRKN